jgi:hypothetical protein
MKFRKSIFGLVSAALLSWTVVLPQMSPAGAVLGDGCPPTICSNIAHPNLLQNPSFEIVGVNGPSTYWSGPMPFPFPESAAAGWGMHNDNFGCGIKTNLVPSTRPGGGMYMIAVKAGGVETGILQTLPSNPNPIVASVWVYVKSGFVIMQTSAGSLGPYAKSTKLNDWELLQLYNDGSTPVDYYSILNQSPGGGAFYADLACETKWMPDYARSTTGFELPSVRTFYDRLAREHNREDSASEVNKNDSLPSFKEGQSGE